MNFDVSQMLGQNKTTLKFGCVPISRSMHNIMIFFTIDLSSRKPNYERFEVKKTRVLNSCLTFLFYEPFSRTSSFSLTLKYPNFSLEEHIQSERRTMRGFCIHNLSFYLIEDFIKNYTKSV